MNPSTAALQTENERIVNPPMPEWATEDNGFTVGPTPNLTRPCGCYVRRPDYEAILCDEHLAELNGDAAIPPAEETR